MHYERWRRTGDPTTPTYWDVPREERFWRQVDRSAGPEFCWPWVGYVGKPVRLEVGYGRWAGGYAHRFALEQSLRRALHRGMEAAHTCDNPICCNPKHLYEADRAANTRDAVVRRRMPAGERNHFAKLTNADVAAIRASWETASVLAARYGISKRHIGRLRAGTRWKAAA